LRVLHYALIHPDGVRLLQLDASIEFDPDGNPAISFLACLLNDMQIEPLARRRTGAAVQSTHADGRTTDLLTVAQLLQMIRGVNENIRLNGFNWHGRSRERPKCGNILHQCMLSCEHEPVRSLIPALVELVSSLLNQPSDWCASIDHPLVDSRNETSLFLLFHRNPCMDATLLPMVRLLRAHGANVNLLTSNFETLWDELSYRCSAGKVDFLLRWLLTEPDLSVFDLISIISQGGRRPIVGELLVLREKVVNNTPQQIMRDIIERMAAEQMRRQNNDAASVAGVDGSAGEESPHSIHDWLQQQLNDLPPRIFSAHMRDQLRAPYDLVPFSSKLDIELTPEQMTRRRDLITELIAAITEHPERVRLDETDGEGCTLLAYLLTVPTTELMRLEPHADWLITAIGAFDPLILRRRILHTHYTLDFLLQSHRPHERGDFIWRLSDALLTKALELTPPRYPTIDSILLRSIGSPRVWWSQLVASHPAILGDRMDTYAYAYAVASAFGCRPPLVSMQRVKLVVDLLAHHGAHRCPTSGADFYDILLHSRQVERVREWIDETRSTDGLWPIRHADDRHAGSLLETAIEIEASAPPKHKSNATEIVRYLQTEYAT
jgi:hypothetical protein